MSEISKLVQQTKAVGLQLTGLGFKIMKEGKVTDERQSMLSTLTDQISLNADSISTEATNMQAMLNEKSKKMELMKKEEAIQKRKYSEVCLERDELQDECRRLREEIAGLKTDLNSSQQSLLALGFNADDDDDDDLD